MPAPPSDPAPSRTGPALRLGALAGIAALVVGLIGAYAGSGGRLGPVEAVIIVVPFGILVFAIVAAKVYAGGQRPPER